MLTIYTDGSSLGNPGPGGWAAVIKDEQNNTTELSGGFKHTTNNRMELLGIIESLKFARDNNEKKVIILTDSKLICNSINKGWLNKWSKTNWKKSDGKKVLNIDLWKILIELMKDIDVAFNWVAGHSGIPGNERCDTLCKAAAEKATATDVGYVNKTDTENSLFTFTTNETIEKKSVISKQVLQSKCKKYELFFTDKKIEIYDKQKNKIMEFPQ